MRRPTRKVSRFVAGLIQLATNVVSQKPGSCGMLKSQGKQWGPGRE